jgi:hypothetical protein
LPFRGLVYPAADRHVNQIIWTGTAWVNQDLTAAAGNPALTGWGSPLMTYGYNGWRYIAYVDTNQHINQMVWTGAAWPGLVAQSVEENGLNIVVQMTPMPSQTCPGYW